MKLHHLHTSLRLKEQFKNSRVSVGKVEELCQPLAVQTHTDLQRPLGPVAVADDDRVRTSHGADVLESGSTTNGDGGHSKVLNRRR